MMKKINSLFFLLLLITGTVTAGQLEECNSFTSGLNKNYPQKVDKITTVKGTVCTPDGKEISLEYLMVIDDEYASLINQSAINKEMQPKQKNFWCTDPTQRELIKLYSIRYRYYSQSGSFLGLSYINKKMC